MNNQNKALTEIRLLTEKEKTIILQETQDSFMFNYYGERKWADAINYFNSKMELNAFEIFYTLRSRYMRKAMEQCGDEECAGDSRSAVERYFDKDTEYKKGIYLGAAEQKDYLVFEKKEFKKRVLTRFKELKSLEKIKKQEREETNKAYRF